MLLIGHNKDNLNDRGRQVDITTQIMQISIRKSSTNSLQSSQITSLRVKQRTGNSSTHHHLRRHTWTVLRCARTLQSWGRTSQHTLHFYRRFRGQGLQLSINNRTTLLL